MTKGTRYFILGSVATLMVGLGAGLIAYYGGFPTNAFSRAGGPEELRYVPRDAAVVAYADVRDVMSSELRRHLRELHPEGEHEGQEEFQRQTGINIETDIERVVAFMTSDAGAANHKNGVVLARGRFDAVRLEGLARNHAGRVEDYKGKRLFTHEMDEGSSEQVALAFLEPGLVAFGGSRLVRRAIDLDKGGENVTANEELMKLVRDLDEGNAWAVGRFDVLTAEARLPEGIASQIPALTWFTASGHINGGLSGTLKAEARDEAAAQNLRDVLRGFMALAKLQAGSKPEMQTMVQSLELGGTGKTIALSFSVPAELFDAIGPKARPRREPK